MAARRRVVTQLRMGQGLQTTGQLGPAVMCHSVEHDHQSFSNVRSIIQDRGPLLLPKTVDICNSRLLRMSNKNFVKTKKYF
ncbi:MAG: hypothetical protein ACOYB1_08990 [Limnohabitans sp.]